MSVKSHHIETLRNVMKIMNFVRGIFCFVIVTCFVLEGAEKITKKPEYKVDGIPTTADKICLACLEGDMDRVKHLGIWGKNTNINYLNTLPIFKCEGSVTFECSKGVYTPLICAIKAEQTHIVKALFKDADYLFLDINKKNRYGTTALHCAVKNGCLEYVTLLLEHNAKVNEKDCYGYTSLHYAVWGEHVKGIDLCIIQNLVKHGASMRIKNNDGLTPLFHATQCVYENPEEFIPLGIDISQIRAPRAAQCLLELGAPIDEINKIGISSLYLLKINRDEACQEWALKLFQQGEMSKEEMPKRKRSLVITCLEVLEKNGLIKNLFGTKVNDDVRGRYAQYLAHKKTVPEVITFLKQVSNMGIKPEVQENFVVAYAREEPKICIDERVFYYYGSELAGMNEQQKKGIKSDFLTKRENYVYARVSQELGLAITHNIKG